MRKILLLAITVVTVMTTSAQDFSNKGKDFWVGYGYHQQMTNGGGGGSQDMVLYFATEQVTNITITIPGTGYVQNITTPAGNNVLTSATIPKTGVNDARLLTEGLSNKGIHVTSDKPMVAYAHVYNQSVSGATILFPTNTLGRDYYSVNYKNWSNSANSNCWFYIVAADTGTTTIQVTPTGNTTGGWTAGNTYTITLTQGQVYNVMGSLISSPANCNPVCTGFDLTGSIIKSVNTGSGCKKIAVFSGSGRISITCNNNSSSSDNYMVQAMPKTAWGKKYLTVPANGNQANNIYRICVSNPATIVKINGVTTTLPLQNGFYYEMPSTNQPQLIEADSAIMVAQYFTSQNACGNGNPGDPEVIYLSAVEQNINKVLWNATPNWAITSHNFNVVLPNSGTAVSSFRLDGAAVTGFVVHPQDPAYVYLRRSVSSGFHVIQSDSGFNAIAYGFGNAESYGYNAGTNIKDLYQQIGVSTQYGIETTPSVCTNSPFRFKVSLPYIPDSMRWNFNGAVGMLPNNNTVYIDNTGNVAEDSTTVINGKIIHWYSIPTLYTFTTVGVYPITITTFVPNNDCGSIQDIDFDLGVSDPPAGSFTWTPGGCVAEPYQFTETTPQVPKTTYRFWWNFGDPGSGVNNTSNLRNPQHLFSAPGTYTVRYSSITTPGCLSDTISNTVVVPDLPNATISGNNTVCINTAPAPDVVFTGTDGTAPYIFTYTINGGAPLTLNSVGNTATIQAPTNVAGTFVYNLVSVRNQNPPASVCTRNITGQTVTVNITPDATITLTSAGGTNNQTVCINNPIINITYAVGGSGTGGNVSGLPTGVTGTYAGGVITITGTPSVSGVFPYTVSTTGPCITPTATGTITVTADGTLSLTSGVGSDNQTLCINTPLLINITYAVGGSGTGGSVSGLPAGVTGVFAGGVITISGTPGVSGVFNYTVTTTGPCIIPTATGTITVTADGTLILTSASGTDNQTVCINNPIINITYAVGGTGTGGSVSGLPAGVTGTYAGGVITITGTPSVNGVFNYTVTTTGPCVIPTATGTITVTEDGTLTLTSGVGSDNQTLCINTPLLINITYAIGGSGTGGSVSGLPAGVTGVFAGGVITISGTPSVSGVFNYTVTTTGPCIIPTATGTITVTADATITLTSASGTDNQSLCINVPITNITYAVGGTGTGGSVTGLPPGVTGVFAGGIITISGTPSSTVGSPFNYTVTTTGPCVIPTATGTITVNPDASIVLTSAGPTANQELCRNSTLLDITYAISGGGTGATVTGLPAGVTGVFAGGVFTISGSPTVAGLFNYTVTTTGTCVQNNATGTILVNQLPTASFTHTLPSCETRLISFTDASVPNSGVLTSWTWDFGDGSPTDPNQNPTHVYATAGTYTVTLSVTTDKGCISNPIASIPVTINNRPAAGFIIPEVCLSDTYAQFTDTSSIAFGAITGWNWNFGDPGSGPSNTSTLQNPQHSYTAVGNYNVELIVTSALGCRDTIVQVLTVNGSFPVANFNVLNPTGLCANDSVAIVEASTVFPGVITKIEIHWDNVGFPAVFETDNAPFSGKIYRHLYPNFQAPLTKTFTIRYRAYSGGVCVNDKLSNITVNAAPLVQFNNMPDTCFLAAPFQITQASEIGGVPGSGVFTGPGISPTGIFSPAVAGIGTHTLLYTFTSDVGGCVDSMSNTITVLDTATALFSYVAPICEQAPASFTDLSTAPATVTLSTTVWNFGDGSPIEVHPAGSTFTHVFTAPGTFTVTMYNVSAYGCNSTVTSQSVTVDANHSISLNAGSNDDQTVCINVAISPIVYTLGGGATGATVTGLPTGVNYVVSGNTLTISGTPSPAAGGPVFNYDIITTGNTCVIANISGRITVSPNHTIAFTSGDTTQSVCINTPIDPIVYTIGGGATGVTVTNLPAGIVYSLAGNILTISGSPTSIAGGPQFAYTITTGGNGCITASADGEIAVHPYPVPAFTVDKTAYCIPNAIVKFTNGSTTPDGSGMTYVWEFGDGSGSTLVNPTHWYSSGVGPFTVRLTVTNIAIPVLNGGGQGCTSLIDVPMTSIHPQPKADFVFNKPSVCIGDNVTITDNTDGKDGIVNQWRWNMGDGSIRTTNPVTYTYFDTITYNITMYSINSFGCNSDTITKPFTVYPYPQVNAGPDRFVLEGGSIQLETISFANDPQYSWAPVTYLSDSRVAQPRVIDPKTDMTYGFTVRARGGCERTDYVFVKLLKFPVIPNTFTPNGDGINDTWRIDFLNTYPNNRVQIFTRTGKLVFESKGYNSAWDGTIKGKPMPFDTYYYIIEPGNGRDPITGYVTIIK